MEASPRRQAIVDALAETDANCNINPYFKQVTRKGFTSLTRTLKVPTVSYSYTDAWGLPPVQNMAPQHLPSVQKMAPQHLPSVQNMAPQHLPSVQNMAPQHFPDQYQLVSTNLAQKRLQKIQISNEAVKLRTANLASYNPGKATMSIPCTVDRRRFQMPDPGVVESMRNRAMPRYKPQRDPDHCCCKREKKTVWCIMCGFHFQGNIKMVCPKHPSKIFLYDLDICGNPKCRAPNLLTEIDLDD